MKIILALILFFIAFMCFMIYLVGSHGHLMFRPYMMEDRIIWGIAFIPVAGGLLLLTKAKKKKIERKSV